MSRTTKPGLAWLVYCRSPLFLMAVSSHSRLARSCRLGLVALDLTIRSTNVDLRPPFELTSLGEVELPYTIITIRSVMKAGGGCNIDPPH